MAFFLSMLAPGLLLCTAIRLLSLPIKWTWKALIHSVCGFVCLWLMNSISGFTGVCFPVNLVTVLTAGFLGIPGIALLAAIEVLC